MDRYFPVVSKPSSLQRASKQKPIKSRYQPYRLKSEPDGVPRKLSQFKEQLRHSNDKPSSSALTKILLDTLSDESNPITHSDIGQRSDRVVSVSTGHQISEVQRDRKLFLEDRGRKLVVQQQAGTENSKYQVLSNVRIYIDGFLENTTDIEMKAIIIRAGGQVVATASGSTHILTSQQLSGSKTHKLLTAKSRNIIHVVRPEWVTDSVKVGKRRPERPYSILKNSSTKILYDMLQK